MLHNLKRKSMIIREDDKQQQGAVQVEISADIVKQFDDTPKGKRNLRTVKRDQTFRSSFENSGSSSKDVLNRSKDSIFDPRDVLGG